MERDVHSKTYKTAPSYNLYGQTFIKFIQDLINLKIILRFIVLFPKKGFT